MEKYTKEKVNDIFSFIWDNHFRTNAFMEKTKHLDLKWSAMNKERINRLIEKEEEDAEMDKES